MISKIITIDQSTSATKAMLFSESCELLHRVNIEHQQFYPQLGWVEHDAEEIYKNTIEAIHCLLEKEEVNGKDISYSLAITNQRETVVVWNRHTGKSVYHAVVWQCQRGAAICKELKDKGYSELVQRKTGLLIDPYFSASGAKWILDNVENARELAEKGDEVCISAIKEMCDVLGKGLATICYVLNPDTIVLGGGVMAQKKILENEIIDSLKRYLKPILAEHLQVCFAEYGNEAGMVGALYNFQNKCGRK